MRNYNFNEKLSWQEFQTLACEIVQKREGVQLQTFRPGKDEGVDGLWCSGDVKLIVQAKRYTDFNKLFSDLKGKELKKVRRLNPNRYILVVSLALSKGQWEKIYQLFEGYIKESCDLVDANQLNSLLAVPAYRKIERNYTSLWLPDATTVQEILNEIVHKNQKTRNRIEYQKALKSSQSFIQTDIYNQALLCLNRNHVLIISGEPGMGKTTLAQILALEFLNVKNYQGFIWADHLDDIYAQLDDTEKQVFLLDDFWGSSFHQGNQRRSNRDLDSLFELVKSDSSKRLIITSREYIVQQELEKNPELEHMIKRNKFECVLRGYSDAEKAKIYFSHLKQSGLEYEYVRALYYICDKVVYNKGYSPRSIEQFIKQNKCNECSPYDYANELLDYLEYPENFWKSIFNELSEGAQIVLGILAISYTPIGLRDIRLSYGKYVQEYIDGRSHKSFESCVSEIEGTFIITDYDEDLGDIAAEFMNPSVLDFLLQCLKEKQEYYIPRLCKISTFYNQLLMLLEYFHCNDEQINWEVKKRCIAEFYTLPMKLQDYGAPEMGEQIGYEGSNWSGRAFHLMRIARPLYGDKIWLFIRQFVEAYYDCLRTRDLFDGVNELNDFVGLVKLCEKQGMHFDAEWVMREFLGCAKLVDSYIGFEDFEKIYPTAFRHHYSDYRIFLKTNLKRLILDTLAYLYDDDYWDQADWLVERAPHLVRNYGLRYSKKFKEEIQLIAGWCVEELPKVRQKRYKRGRKIPKEKESYEEVKIQAYDWLLGFGAERLAEDEVAEIVRQQNFHKENEQWLLNVMETGTPWYVYELIHHEIVIRTLKSVEEKGYALPREMDSFMSRLLLEFSGDDYQVFGQLINFSAEYIASVLFKDYPQITEHQWKKMSVYEEYVKGSAAFETRLFETVLCKDDKWVGIRCSLLMLYCMCRILMNDENLNWNDILEEGAVPWIQKNSRGLKDVYYPEFAFETHINCEWKDWMIRIFHEIVPERFALEYVKPRIRLFLESLEQKEDPILSLLQQLQYEIDIDVNKEISGGSMFLISGVELLEVLGIAQLQESDLTKEQLQVMCDRTEIAKKHRSHVTVSLYRESDLNFLKLCGVYQMFEQYLEEAKRYCE